MSASSFSMNGLCSVNLGMMIRNGRISCLTGYPHREYNDTDAPTIDTVAVSVHILLNDLRCQITGSSAHRLMENRMCISGRLMSARYLAHLQHGQTINVLGQSKVCNLDHRRVVFRKENVLHGTQESTHVTSEALGRPSPLVLDHDGRHPDHGCRREHHTAGT